MEMEAGNSKYSLMFPNAGAAMSVKIPATNQAR